MLLSLEIGCLCVNRLRVHTVDSEGQTQWVFMLSCLCTHMQRLRQGVCSIVTEQKHIHLLHCIFTFNWVAYSAIRHSFPLYLVLRII